MSATDSPLGLLTDLYQLTMGAAYWRQGMAERQAVFHLTFRRSPFGGEYAVACGLADAVDFLHRFRFSEPDIDYLRSLRGRDDRPLFEPEYLAYLGQVKFQCDVDAIAEGTVVFPHEPLIRVRGPLLQAQMVETALLTIINFETLIATKAARVCRAAGDDPVLEFGLRRAQGVNGGLSASRAAYIGGTAATSNVLAGRTFNIPVKGTHAHSWVMSFDNEMRAFEAYAEAMPNNCLLLVDTFDTLAGVDKAIEVGRQLRRRGQDLMGVRLDSGDLAALSIAARSRLDAAGFGDAAIVASNDLDEFEIEKLKQQGARINVWGVGTRLVTGNDQPALGGVYKLAAVRAEDGVWEHKIKLSEQPIKVSNPGVMQVHRFLDGPIPCGDVIVDELDPPGGIASFVPFGTESQQRLPGDLVTNKLLQPVFRDGRLVADLATPQQARSRAQQELHNMPEAVTRHQAPEPYPVGLESSLHDRKMRMIEQAQRVES